MVTAFDGTLPYAHHAVQITADTPSRPSTDDIETTDAVLADAFGFALRYEVTDRESSDQYRISYLLPKGKAVTEDTFATLRSQIHDQTTLRQPTIHLLSLDPTEAELSQMAFVGTPPSEALRDAWQQLRDRVAQLKSESEPSV